MGFPGYKRFFRLIKHSKISNCKVSLDDDKRALHLYGPDEATIMGKTTGKKQSCIKDTVVIAMPNS